MKTQILILAVVAASAIAAVAQGATRAESAGVLTAQQYLDQVRGKSPGVKGSLESAAGASERSVEARLVTMPSFFADAQWAVDEKPALNPVLNWSQINYNTYSLGVAENFPIGLSAKLSYGVASTAYKNYVTPYTTGIFSQSSFYEITPRIELTQQLWSGGFGRTIRAQRDSIEAQALASSNGARFQASQSLVQAEGYYWRLAFARQLVDVQKDALERAKKIQEWTSRQARLSLADRSDALQSQANLDLRRVELQAALDEERTSRLSFNLARAADAGSSDDVPERLESADPKRVLEMKAPERGPEPRADVAAAEQQSRAVVANATIAAERDLPTLELFASYQLYGRDPAYGAASTNSFSDNVDTRAVGVRFSVPLDLAATHGARQGWAREQAGAELTYQQRLLEQEQSWADLSKKFSESRTRLGLLLQLEETQEAKLNREKERLRGGHSTTFQVLTFEQDFAQAQISRIRAEADVLTALVQMKIFTNPELPK